MGAAAISRWTRVGPRARDVGLMLVAAPFVVADLDRGALPHVVVGAAAVVTLWWRRRYCFAVLAACTVAALVTDVPVPMAIALFTLAIQRRDLVLALGAATTTAAFTFLNTVRVESSFAAGLAVSVLEAGFCVATGAYIGARRDLVDSLRERAQRAESERELRADQARLGERARIAREMHDVVAHKVSLIALHAGALEVGSNDDPARVRVAAALITSTARQALDDLREVLGVLRPGAQPADRADLAPQPGIVELERLLSSSRAAGVPVELRVGVTGTVPETVSRTAYRVVQEAMTNVHKHAGGAATVVSVGGDAVRGVNVEVVNRRPAGAAARLPGSGAGIVGLTERVALLGGTLGAGPTDDGGWRLVAWLPFDMP